MGANTEIDDGLTDEERAALESDDDIIDGNQDDPQDPAESDDPQDPPADPDEDPEDPADPAEPVDPPADPQDPPADPEPAPAPAPTEHAPILVVQPPADAEAKLQEISTQKADLMEKFDDGDITVKEYQQQIDALNKQEREIELAVHKAQMAAEIEQQRQANEWNATVNGFIAENTQYNPEANPVLYQMLDLEVRRVALTDEFKNRTDMAAGKAILQKAHENIAKATGMQIKPKGKTTPAPKSDAPPSLHNVPAADLNDTKGGKYAVLDRLSTSDPIAYEEALMKLPEAERDAYLNS
ncbi:MAG TPA: hypothetical protein VFW49_14860 [Fluviicoccus sp.]|nr:hypothetical protein [Fluviicoccus sp.]